MELAVDLGVLAVGGAVGVGVRQGGRRGNQRLERRNRCGADRGCTRDRGVRVVRKPTRDRGGFLGENQWLAMRESCDDLGGRDRDLLEVERLLGGPILRTE